MKSIYPSLIAKNQKELDLRFKKVGTLSKFLHLDIMDGKFVKNKSLMFDFKLPKTKKYYAHLMVRDPLKWIRSNYSKISGVAIHFESNNLDKSIELAKQKKKHVALVIKPRTSVKKIVPYLNKVEFILVMTVNPGKYGAKFLSNNLKKIDEIKKLNKKMDVGLDGGINDKTIKKAKKADFFICGSYLQKSDNAKESLSRLNKLAS